MKSPETENRSGKDQPGCSYFISRIIFGVAAIFLFDYLMVFIFHRAYPHDEITTGLIPFQNHYFATTDAFITSEGVLTEFSIDPGPPARLLSLCLFPVIGFMVLFSILYFIPITKNLINYTWHVIFISFAFIMVNGMFFPPYKTVFDRENKIMTIHTSEWMVIHTKTEIPFDQISHFKYKVVTVDGDDHYVDVDYADMYAITKDGREIFVGDNQVGDHAAGNATTPVDAEHQQEIDAAIRSLNALIGM